MHILHVIPDLRLDEPQMAVVEFCRVARMRGIQTSVLALSDHGEAVRSLLELQHVSVQTLSSEQGGALQMQLLQAPANAVHTHSVETLARVLPAVSDTPIRLFHTFHHGSVALDGLPGGHGFVDEATWIDGAHTGQGGRVPGHFDTTPILDGVWSPPIGSLEPQAQRDALGARDGQWVVGASGWDECGSTLELLIEMREQLGGDDIRVVVFGGDYDDHEIEGFSFESSDDAGLIDRLGGVDIFVQLRDRDFSVLSLLAMARRVPIIMPGPDEPEGFRGGWSPLRFTPPDVEDLADQVGVYVDDPELHAAHRGMVRDYVLTYRDSMSMVAEYERLYEQATSGP